MSMARYIQFSLVENVKYLQLWIAKLPQREWICYRFWKRREVNRPESFQRLLKAQKFLPLSIAGHLDTTKMIRSQHVISG